MIKHFGLSIEFSPKVDILLKALNESIINKDVRKMESILLKYESILTPSLRLEIESRIIEAQSKKND